MANASSAGSSPASAGFLHAANCSEERAPNPFTLTVDFGAYPVGRIYPFGAPFETFSSGWNSWRVEPEMASAWSRLPDALRTEAAHPVTARSYLYFRLGLRRDILAWHKDPIGGNIPFSAEEVDLNEPSLGFFHAETEAFAFTLGRFQAHWSQSPEHGLSLSRAVPYHNGASFQAKLPHVRYRFMVSSLNPWLEGTPVSDSSSEEYPPGSEEYRQRHYPATQGASLGHRRVYAERIKTFFAHRVSAWIGPLEAGITETQVIGGKVPDFRDAGPFVFFHNDFKDGYTNIALGFDASLRLPAGFSVIAEIYLDDVRYSETEEDGGTPELMGWLAALRHTAFVKGWRVSQSAHLIRTDPFLYGYLQPLNTMASRHILASNAGEDNGGALTDRFVADYPLGYLRGGDCFDFWYAAEAGKGPARLAARAALLARGETDLYRPYEEFYDAGHSSPGGIAEREVRLEAEAGYRFRYGLSARAGLAWQSITDRDHVRGSDVSRAQAYAGMAWRLGG